jgi:hypothetical protein
MRRLFQHYLTFEQLGVAIDGRLEFGPTVLDDLLHRFGPSPVIAIINAQPGQNVAKNRGEPEQK